jgi:hypothetical protein
VASVARTSPAIGGGDDGHDDRLQQPPVLGQAGPMYRERDDAQGRVVCGLKQPTPADIDKRSTPGSHPSAGRR